MHRKYSLVSSLLLELASELDIELLVEPTYAYAGRIKTKEGKVFYYRSTHFDINGLGASEIAKDKAYASFFIHSLGFPVPLGESFYSDHWCSVLGSKKDSSAAVAYATKIGFPVMVKPNSESEGRGVEKVFTITELHESLSTIFSDLKDKVALVQSVVMGSDYRIVVLDSQVLCAYKRTPLSVIGDGKHSIRSLLLEKRQQFTSFGRHTTINMADQRIKRTLSHEGMTFATILPSGKRLALLANANLSSGGQAEDISSLLHQGYKDMAITLTAQMGLRFCGIDIMTPSPIDMPPDRYTVIEINAAPGLDYYAQTGLAQREVVKVLYKKLLSSLIRG